MKVYELNREYESLMIMNDMIINMENDGQDLSEMKDDLAKQFEELAFETESKMENIVKLIRNLEAEEAAFNSEIDRLKKKADSRSKQAKYIKDNLVKPMLLKRETGKITAGLFKVSLRKSEAVHIIDEDKVPMIYKTKKEVISISKKDIKEALKTGEVQGAEIIVNKSVQIK